MHKQYSVIASIMFSHSARRMVWYMGNMYVQLIAGKCMFIYQTNSYCDELLDVLVLWLSTLFLIISLVKAWV